MRVDFWYPGEKIAMVDYTFYPNDGEWRGNLYNAAGKMIGDYSSKNSVEVEKRFPGIFKN